MLTYIKNYIITFRYVKLISYFLSKYLHNKIQKYHNQGYDMGKCAKYNIQVYYYGLQIIIGGINKFLLLIIPGLLLNILPQLLLVTISFASLRIWTGGLHYDSYTKCSYISLLSFTLMALLAKYIILNQLITALIFLIVFIIILLYAPIEHKNHPIKENKKLKFKIIAICVLITLFIINISTNNNIISNSIIYSLLLISIISTPFANKLK